MTLTRRQFAGAALGAAAFLTLGAKTASAGGTKRTGSLSGRQGYAATGTVQVETVDGKTKVVFGSDYSFTGNPPDIKIGFGSGEKYAKGSKIHEKLSIKEGAAEFEVPAGIDTSQYDELYIYCEQFSVILAVAPLS
ncbi:MAG: DM13 domain-containing protein [Pseudomonadota bacterium]